MNRFFKTEAVYRNDGPSVQEHVSEISQSLHMILYGLIILSTLMPFMLALFLIMAGAAL